MQDSRCSTYVGESSKSEKLDRGSDHNCSVTTTNLEPFAIDFRFIPIVVRIGPGIVTGEDFQPHVMYRSAIDN